METPSCRAQLESAVASVPDDSWCPLVSRYVDALVAVLLALRELVSCSPRLRAPRDSLVVIRDHVLPVIDAVSKDLPRDRYLDGLDLVRAARTLCDLATEGDQT